MLETFSRSDSVGVKSDPGTNVLSKLLVFGHAFIPSLLRSKSHFQLISLQTKAFPEGIKIYFTIPGDSERPKNLSSVLSFLFFWIC